VHIFAIGINMNSSSKTEESKEAAEELKINYSTAKTIVQTFRREKRVAKKPKHCTETKKAIKHERLLRKLLKSDQVRTCEPNFKL